jgi:SAM-dependent methyltransferase
MPHHHHTAEAGTPVEIDWASEVAHLQEADALFLPMRERIAAWLAPPAGGRVLDAGCGTGAMTVPLARAVGPSGRVVAVDGEPAALAALRDHLETLGLGDRVETVHHDLQPGGTEDETGAGPPLGDDFDLVWASHSVHHLPDQAAAVRSMAGWLRPGGRLALAEGGLRMRCLPFDTGVGEPGLEERIEAAFTWWFNAMRASLPGAVRSPHGWPRLLRDAGLEAERTSTFLFEAGPPLEPSQVAFVRRYLADALERIGDLLEEPDRAALARLCDPDDQACVDRRDDVFVLTAESVHVAARPVEPAPRRARRGS